MAKLLTALLLLAIFGGLIVLAASAWRRRVREQSVGFSAPAETLALSPDLSANAETVQAQYVATTFAGEPLNRVTAHGLGFRGRAAVTASAAGILIDRRAERALAIESDSISGVDFVQAVIDRATEKNGLVAINWSQDGTSLTTVLRFNSAADRKRFLQASPVLTRKAI